MVIVGSPDEGLAFVLKNMSYLTIWKRSFPLWGFKNQKDQKGDEKKYYKKEIILQG